MAQNKITNAKSVLTVVACHSYHKLIIWVQYESMMSMAGIGSTSKYSNTTMTLVKKRLYYAIA